MIKILAKTSKMFVEVNFNYSVGKNYPVCNQQTQKKVAFLLVYKYSVVKINNETYIVAAQSIPV